MITDKKYFADRLAQISHEIFKHENRVTLINKGKIFDYSFEELSKRFDYLFLEFPYDIEPKSDSLGLSIYTIEVFNLDPSISFNNGKIDPSKIEISKSRFEKQELSAEDIYYISDFLEDYFHRITYEFGTLIENARKLHFFQGVKKEETILLNLLNRYRMVLKDKSFQLKIFYGVKLTKLIADMVTELLVDAIEQRLKVLNPVCDSKIPTKETVFVKSENHQIEWHGTQQELCELIIELERKGWIPKIPNGNRKSIAASITSLFDLHRTRKSSKSNVNNSFYQIFKGEVIDNNRRFPFQDAPNYISKFDGIYQNRK